METKEKKNKIRTNLKELRSKLSKEFVKTNSDTICTKLLSSKEYSNANNILCYMSIKNEVDVLPIIERALIDNKNVYLPKVNGEYMDFYRIYNSNECDKGAFGILEPKETDIFDEDDGLVIVPLVGFDEELHRIGFGAGYYDKYFSKHNTLTKIAVAYEFQKTDTLFEIDKYDISMDYVYTQNNIYGGQG